MSSGNSSANDKCRHCGVKRKEHYIMVHEFVEPKKPEGGKQ